MRMILMTLLLCCTALATAQDVRYVSDQQLVPMRSGEGTQFRIVHRGLPSGTQLTLLQDNPDSGYSQVRTPGGTEGWILTRYLLRQPIARDQLAAAIDARKKAQQQVSAIKTQLQTLQQDLAETRKELDSNRAQLGKTGDELEEITRISSNAITLDKSNRQLVEQTEVLRSRIEVLEADNQRLLDSDSNEAFLNGALAVALGVLLTLIIPRVWPKRRASSSWA